MTEINATSGGVARQLIVQALERAPEAVACGFLSAVVASVFGLVAGVIACVVIAAGAVAAPVVGDRVFWRRFRPAVSAPPVVAHLEVDLDAETAAVVDAVAENRDVTAAEAVRRALRLLGDFEGVAPSAGVDVDPEPLAAEDVSNYVQLVQGRLRTALPVLDTDLVRLCALLALVKGTDTTRADVHAAWSVWRSATDPRHPAIEPYAQLPADVRELDGPVVDAIRLVAASIEGGQR